MYNLHANLKKFKARIIEKNGEYTMRHWCVKMTSMFYRRFHTSGASAEEEREREKKTLFIQSELHS